jgi:hypothetical protein
VGLQNLVGHAERIILDRIGIGLMDGYFLVEMGLDSFSQFANRLRDKHVILCFLAAGTGVFCWLLVVYQ